MKKLILAAAITAATMTTSLANAAEYQLDIKGAHAFVNFKIKHLGYSWLTGRFNTFDGQLEWDATKPETSKIEVTIQTNSIDSNHAERDKHLKGEDFLNVKEFPTATFKSTAYKAIDENTGELTGEFTLHGVSKNISFPITKIGEGKDPWGGYRVGFEGATSLKLADYGIDYNLGPASTHVDLELYIEGIRK